VRVIIISSATHCSCTLSIYFVIFVQSSWIAVY
jgi:hypothetical protein